LSAAVKAIRDLCTPLKDEGVAVIKIICPVVACENGCNLTCSVATFDENCRTFNSVATFDENEQLGFFSGTATDGCSVEETRVSACRQTTC
jgi:hypothetical protein